MQRYFSEAELQRPVECDACTHRDHKVLIRLTLATQLAV